MGFRTLMFSWIIIHGFTVTFIDSKGVVNQVCMEIIRKDGLSLINNGINTISSLIIIQNRFYSATKDLYNFMKENKSITIDKISASFSDRFEDLKKVLFSQIKDNFEKSFIYAYTSHYGYDELNASLREHECSKKDLTEREKALAPYAAALTAILMHWDGLESTQEITYRKSTIDPTDLNLYETLPSVAWLNFGSSSTKKSEAEEFGGNAIFIIDNENSYLTKWKPKLICNCSQMPTECEALYPPATFFNVSKINKPSNSNRPHEIYLALSGDEPPVEPPVERKRRSVSPDIYTKNGVCFVSTSFSMICQMNILDLLVLTILGKLGSSVFE